MSIQIYTISQEVLRNQMRESIIEGTVHVEGQSKRCYHVALCLILLKVVLLDLL
jgi:hypothetical protein